VSERASGGVSGLVCNGGVFTVYGRYDMLGFIMLTRSGVCVLIYGIRAL
jgi:hypothetical protein